MLIKRRMGFLCAHVTVCTVALINSAIWGQCQFEKLLPSDAETFDEFGNLVAISCDLAIVRAHNYNNKGILNPDFTTNEATAAMMCRTPSDPNSDDQPEQESNFQIGEVK